MLSVIDDISLMVINKVDKNIGRELENHRVRILQKLCLQRLYKEEANTENMAVNTNGREIFSRDEIESFQKK